MEARPTPEPERSLLLTIDVQRDVSLPGAPFEVEGTHEAVPRMERLVTAFRDRNRPIVHVVRLYRADGSNVEPCRRSLIREDSSVLRPGTEGAELVDGLKPDPGIRVDSERLLAGEMQPVGDREWMMYKPRWGAFYRTPLEEHLTELGVRTLVVCGCNFPNCPRTTIYEASERDYSVVLVEDATSGTYRRGSDELRNIGVSVMQTDGCLDWLSGKRTA